MHHDDLPEQKATRASWKTTPIASIGVWLPYHKTLSYDDYQRISYGLIPKEMEDKWFIFLENQTLALHRSWTGHCIYLIQIVEYHDGYQTTQAWLNRESSQYQQRDDAYDLALITYLIDGMLLHKRVPFPIPHIAHRNPPPGLFQHHIAGTANPEESFPDTTPESAQNRS